MILQPRKHGIRDSGTSARVLNVGPSRRSQHPADNVFINAVGAGMNMHKMSTKYHERFSKRSFDAKEASRKEVAGLRRERHPPLWTAIIQLTVHRPEKRF